MLGTRPPTIPQCCPLAPLAPPLRPADIPLPVPTFEYPPLRLHIGLPFTHGHIHRHTQPINTTQAAVVLPLVCPRRAVRHHCRTHDPGRQVRVPVALLHSRLGVGRWLAASPVTPSESKAPTPYIEHALDTGRPLR